MVPLFLEVYKLKRVLLHGEAALADSEVASLYPIEYFKQLISNVGYHPEQVGFNFIQFYFF